MAEKRKLQQEIDRTLKKVDEGIADFERHHRKLENAPTVAVKEKHELELKREIKKLQRLREMLKTWQTSNDVKDKTAIDESRRKIEREMERYKECEKQSKVKAFSKTGLAQKDKLDPQEQERQEHCSWIRETMKDLQTSLDEYEAEHEMSKNKRSHKPKDDELEALLSTRITRHRWHLVRLEQVLRRLENNSLDLDLLAGLKDCLDVYVAHSEDPEFYFDDELYISLNLEEKEDDDEESSSDHFDGSGGSDGLFGLESDLSSIQGATASSQRHLRDSITLSSVSPKISQPEDNVLPSPLTIPVASTDFSEEKTAKATDRSSSLYLPVSPADHSTALPGNPLPSDAHLSTAVDRPSDGLTGISSSSPEKNKESGPLEGKEDGNQSGEDQSSELKIAEQLDEILGMVDASYRCGIALSDRVRKIHSPPNPLCSSWSSAPLHFPTHPLQVSLAPPLYRILSTGTLFWIFYFLPGTHLSLLATRELKARNWRFLKSRNWWVMGISLSNALATENVQEISLNDFPDLMYFDFEETWQRRKVTDPRIERSPVEAEFPAAVVDSQNPSSPFGPFKDPTDQQAALLFSKEFTMKSQLPTVANLLPTSASSTLPPIPPPPSNTTMTNLARLQQPQRSNGAAPMTLTAPPASPSTALPSRGWPGALPSQPTPSALPSVLDTLSQQQQQQICALMQVISQWGAAGGNSSVPQLPSVSEFPTGAPRGLPVGTLKPATPASPSAATMEGNL